MRVVFFGTPDFAVPSLRALAERFPVVGVVSQPDRPAGRGRRPQPPPVKRAALELRLPVLQPDRVRAPEALAAIETWRPDVLVVAAFGQILPPALLEMPAYGGVNVHASLLPRWRGASPVQSSLLHGDSETGVTIMKMDEGMDTGPILAQRSLTIRSDHTGGSLTAELAELGARLLVETLPDYLAGELTPLPQDEQLATLAPRLRPSDTGLDPAQTALVLERKVRALSPKPAARVLWGDTVMRILDARALPGPASAPGTVVVREGLPLVAAGEGWLQLARVQLPGGKAVDGRAFLAGHGSFVGSVLRPPA